MSDEILPDLIAAVDQQLESPRTAYVAKTLKRLQKSGLDEEQAKEQIAICLGEEMDQVLRKKRGFNEKAYQESLAELPFDSEEE